MTERHSTPQDDELPKRLLSRAAAAESMIPRVGGASTDAGRTFEKDAKLFRDAAAALEDWRGRLAEMCGRVLATQSESASTDEKGRPMTYWGGMATPQSAGTSTTPGRIPELEATRINAEYWLAEAKHPDVEHSSAIMFAEQAINAWKNAAYAMADRFVSSATLSITPEWREQWGIFLKDYNRYVDGDQKMPFSLLRDSMAAFVTETDRMLRAERCATRGHVWVGIGDEGRSVCDDCGIDKTTKNSPDSETTR